MVRQREHVMQSVVFMHGMVSVDMINMVLRIRRDRLLDDSIMEIRKHDQEDLKKKLRVFFEGEEAIDEGGVQKEWFQLVVRDIFDPKYGMFSHTETKEHYWFNHLSDDYLHFELIGMVNNSVCL